LRIEASKRIMLDQAPRDTLTGFYQRDALESYLRQLIAESRAQGKPFSLVLVDVDRFKKYNDKYGHPFGDEILKYATSTLRLTFLEGPCLFFRYGGDEFIVVFPGRTVKETLCALRQCQHNLRHRPCLYGDRFYHVAVSCGVAGFPDDGQTAEELIRNADDAMYFSKRTGRNRTTPYGRIGLLKFRRIVMFLAAIVSALAAVALVYHLTYQQIIRPKLEQLKHIKIVSEPKNLDTVVLRSGLVFDGRILSENRGAVVLHLYFENGGEGQMTFKRSEIAQIKYGNPSE